MASLFRDNSTNKRISALVGHPPVRDLLACFSADGHDARVVGGAVRDVLMARKPGDIDIATTLLPEHTRQRAEAAGWKAVPTGIDHGTITVVVDGTPFEVTTLRNDVKTDGRRAVVAFTRDFREDAFRRDFTINALSASADGVVHDYGHGIADAAKGRVRFMGDPQVRIREDYLRILRFFRFHASHGRGALDEAGLAACSDLKDGLSQISRERIRQETLKLLAAPVSAPTCAEMRDTGILPHVLGQTPISVDDLTAMEKVEAGLLQPPDSILRLAALCAAGEPEQIRDLLVLSNRDVGRLSTAKAGSAMLARSAADKALLMRIVYQLGESGARDAVILTAALQRWQVDQARSCLETVAAISATGIKNPFTSRALAKHGIPPGPRMGRILKAAESSWIEGGMSVETSAHTRLLLNAIAENPD